MRNTKHLRTLLIILLLLIFCVSVCSSAHAEELTPRDAYWESIELLNLYLSDKSDAQVNINKLHKRLVEIDYQYSYEFSQYVEILTFLEAGRLSDAEEWVHFLQETTSKEFNEFISSADFQEKYACIRSVDDLALYVSGRAYEARKQYAEAADCYKQCPRFFDALSRYKALKVVTPTPKPTKAPTPKPTITPSSTKTPSPKPTKVPTPKPTNTPSMTAMEYYQLAETAYAKGNVRDAFYNYLHAGDYSDARIKAMRAGDGCIAAGLNGALFLKEDGTVFFIGHDQHHISTQSVFSAWKDIVAIECGGADIYYGLKSNGTVVASGPNLYGECDVSDWSSIVELAAGSSHVLGRKADGTVVAAGYNASGSTRVHNWKNVTDIEAGVYCSLAVTDAGEILFAGQRDGHEGAANWKNPQQLVASGYQCVIIRSNGQLKSFGKTNVDHWSEIVHVVATPSSIIGFKSDGSLVVSGVSTGFQGNILDAANWQNAAAVGGGENVTYAITTTGRILSTYDDRESAAGGVCLFK